MSDITSLGYVTHVIIKRCEINKLTIEEAKQYNTNTLKLFWNQLMT